MTADLAIRCERAVHVIRADGTVLRAGRAALHVLGAIGFKPLSAFLGIPPLIWIVELLYRMVAANRGRLARFISD